MMKYTAVFCFSAALLITSVSATSVSAAESTQAQLITQAHIRTLAASCAACHGSQGNALHGNAVLAGMDSDYFVSQMLAFKNGSRPATVMHRHAKGLNTDEIPLLADYFAKQTPVAAHIPKAQSLKAAHE
jgi:cytochrome subunit of sulfide dehydrogenase